MRRCTECFTETADIFNVCPRCGSSVGCPAAEGDSPLTGKTLNGRYFIGKTAGRGGFGIIYRAFDTLMSKVVAVKEFYPEKIACRGADGINVLPLGPLGMTEFETRRKIFAGEASVVSGLDGCGFFPQFYDGFEENSTSYIVMEYIDGEPLSSFIGAGTEIAVNAVKETALGLSYLHSADIIHRDISPDNILVCRGPDTPQVKIIDFGAAIKECDINSKCDIILKNGYSSPEQCTDTGVSKQSDVFSLGATLLSLIIGKKPSEEDFRKLRESGEKDAGWGPGRLRRIIGKATEPEPGKRYRDAGDFYRALKKAI